MACGQIEERVFKSDDTRLAFKLPYILTPFVELEKDQTVPTITLKSEDTLKKHFEAIRKSNLNLGGIGIVFGTYDNLHIGHRAMLRAAASLCDELYVGIESQAAAMLRKKGNHPILDDCERVKIVEDFGITSCERIFIRKRALDDIKDLEAAGKTINTVIIGESQKDNHEIVQVVEYTLSKGIQVVAITRLKATDTERDISSSYLHRSGHAKINNPEMFNGRKPQ